MHRKSITQTLEIPQIVALYNSDNIIVFQPCGPSGREVCSGGGTLALQTARDSKFS